jgi:mycothiol synthase
MKSGGLVKIRLDMLSDRPHAMSNYQLQGTDGCYESARAEGEVGRVWLRGRNRGKDAWTPLPELEAEFLPAFWREGMERAAKAGHGGGDYFQVLDFAEAVRGIRPPAIGVHEAMDMTLPGLVSQLSIAEGGRWMDVPDSRTWEGPPRAAQLHMVVPERLLSGWPAPSLGDGYEMRPFRDEDLPAYIELLHKVQLGGEWTPARVAAVRRTILPGGFFVVVHRASGRLVATAMATHHPQDLHPDGGEVGWVAADPEHKGKGLGRAVVLASTQRLIQAGYRRVYLSTDDFRLPAIKVYLDAGFEPLLYQDDMAGRWADIRRKLKR